MSPYLGVNRQSQLLTLLTVNPGPVKNAVAFYISCPAKTEDFYFNLAVLCVPLQTATSDEALDLDHSADSSLAGPIAKHDDKVNNKILRRKLDLTHDFDEVQPQHWRDRI